MVANPQASMLLYWPSLGRQLRIEGAVEPVSSDTSDAYFASRSRGSQLAAAASRQSAPMRSRDELLQRLHAIEEAHPGQVPRPETWGGWRLVPRRIEFWSDGSHRLHMRESYRLSGVDKWERELQQP